jgi:hypothetical protein
MDKTILLASFIFNERVEWFLNYLENKFSIPKTKVFCYKNLDDESKMIMTFKLVIPQNKRLNLKDLFPSAIPIHKKGNVLYTINALNMLIDSMSGDNVGNVDYGSVIINWDGYQNKLILTKGKELVFLNIERVF